MKEYRPRRSPPSTLSSKKRGSKGASFRKAETGVSRSAAMSKGAFIEGLSKKNPPGWGGSLKTRVHAYCCATPMGSHHHQEVGWMHARVDKQFIATEIRLPTASVKG